MIILTPGVHHVPGLAIRSELTILGSGAESTIITVMQQEAVIITSASARLTDLTIRGDVLTGRTTGGVTINGGEVTIERCIIEGIPTVDIAAVGSASIGTREMGERVADAVAEELSRALSEA